MHLVDWDNPDANDFALVEEVTLTLWGRRYLLTVAYRDGKPFVALDHRRITLTASPGTDAVKRAEVMHAWHKSLLHAVVPGLIAKWEPILRTEVKACQRPCPARFCAFSWIRAA